jgi:hypothetical protein
MADKLRLILTIGQIARRLNEPIHRIDYAIKTRNIMPVGIAGNARVFEEEHVEQIAAALREIDSRQEGGAE